MLTFLLVVHALITATLVGVILMQRSEGGGLGMGGSPTGLMSARGAADFLTRATTILATLFVLLSIASAVIVSQGASRAVIDTSLARKTPAPAPEPTVPLNGDPLAAAAGAIGNGAGAVTPPPGTTVLPTTKAPTAVVKPEPVPEPNRTRPTDRPVAKTVKPTVAPTTPPPAVVVPAPVTTPPPANAN